MELGVKMVFQKMEEKRSSQDISFVPILGHLVWNLIIGFLKAKKCLKWD